MLPAESRSRITTTGKKVKGVGKARKAAALCRAPSVKKHSLVAITEDLKRFKAMLAKNNRPGRCACTTYVSQNGSKARS